MSQVPPGGGWGQSPPPGSPERRFAKGAVAGGVPLGIVGTIGLPLLGVAVPVVGPLLFLGLLLGVLLAGILLAASPGPPLRRGLGLGVVIGWGLTLIVAAGLCVAILSSFG
jgi:hypothetical protein